MDGKRAFAVLGLEPTKDENAIRNAYRTKLPLTNPEDDPEGFKQLREAYETALKLAASQDEAEEKEIDSTPSGLFVQKADALYTSLTGRLDAAAWKELFDDPAFLDLDEEENCREKLISYLMNHCYVPTQVWKVLGSELHILEDREKLYEKFPRDFIDYMARKIQKGEDFEFDQLRGDDDVDLDGWIFLFAKAGREENEKNYEAMEVTLNEALTKGIFHPGQSLMQARLCQRKGELEKGDGIIEMLLNSEFGDSLNVLYQSAEYFWETMRKEKASELYLRIQKDNPKHYMANRRLAQWNLEKGAFEEAKQCVNIMLSYPLDDEARKLVDDVNEGLERDLERKIQEDPENLKARMDLGWCYLQDEHPEKALELMQGRTPLPEQEKDYCNLMGKVHYYANQYDQAKPLLKRWAQLLEEQMPADGQAREDDHERMATSHSMLSQILLEDAKMAEGESREALFSEVMEELELAKQAKYNPGQDYSQAIAYLEWGKYQECIRICDGLRQEYPDFSGAVMIHQKACAKLYDAGGVVGDYFALRQLAPDYKESWEMAAEVYYQIKRWDDLEKLLKEAEENSVLTCRLKKYRFHQMVNAAQKKNELLDAIEYAGKILEECDAEGWSDAEKAELVSERARNYWRLESYETALQRIDEAIGLDRGNLMYSYIKAGIKKDQEKYEEALSIYRLCESDYDETSHFYANVGECLYQLRRFEEALPNLKKSVELKPDSPVCCFWIVRSLKALMDREDSLDRMEEALRYADMMIEYRGRSFDYIERGLLYVKMSDYPRAAQDFEKAVETDPKDPYAHSNLARVCRLMNQLDKAAEHGRLAVENSDNDPSTYHYSMLGNVYRQMHRYEDALQVYKDCWEKFPKQREYTIGSLITMYNNMGRWQEALNLLQEFYQGKGKAFAENTVEVYTYAQLYAQAVKYIKHNYKKEGFTAAQIEEALARVYWYEGSLKKCAEHAEKALSQISKDDSSYPDLCRLAARAYLFLQKGSAARKWAQKGLEYYRDKGGYDKWLNALDGRLNNMYEIGVLQLCAGNVKAVQSLIAEMKTLPRCLHCNFCCCTDAFELQADMLVMAEDYDGALKIYDMVAKENGLDRDVRMKTALVRKRMGL